MPHECSTLANTAVTCLYSADRVAYLHIGNPARSTHRFRGPAKTRTKRHFHAARFSIYVARLSIARDNEMRRPPGGKSSPMKEGAKWKRQSSLATPVPIRYPCLRATTMSTTRHTTCRPDHCMKLMHHVQLTPHRGYLSARAGTMATTRRTISAFANPRGPSSALVRLFRLRPGHGIHVLMRRTSTSHRCGLFRDGVRQH